MTRVASVLLTVLGLLICPFVCLGKTGGLCANPSNPVACCHADSRCSSEKETSFPANDEAPAPRDDCSHDCVVSKGTIETGQKTPREITQSLSDLAFVSFVLLTPISDSLAFETALREEAASGQPLSGRDLRVILASFLL